MDTDLPSGSDWVDHPNKFKTDAELAAEVKEALNAPAPKVTKKKATKKRAVKK